MKTNCVSSPDSITVAEIQTDANTVLPAVFSQDYLEWVKQANLQPLTNTQHKFAEWLLLEDNAKIISQIGDLDTIFISVRRWLKNGM